MASMSGMLIIFGLFVLGVCGAIYYGMLEQFVSPYKVGFGALFGVMLASVAVIGVFFLALGVLYRQWE